MTTALITHPACLEHDTGPYHPETAERLRAVLAALETPEFTDLLRESAPWPRSSNSAACIPAATSKGLCRSGRSPGSRCSSTATRS